MMLPSWHVVILALAWCLSLGVAFVAGVAAAIVFVAEVTFLTVAKILASLGRARATFDDTFVKHDAPLVA